MSSTRWECGGLLASEFLVHGFMSFLAPSFNARAYAYIQRASLPGEGLTSPWMATAGLSVAKWRGSLAEPQGKV
jgi:hypothetical protein